MCPRCGNGDAKDGHVLFALLERWRRDGVLPVHGRDIEVVRRQTKVLDVGQQRAACVEQAQEVEPFLVISNPGTLLVAECLAKEFDQHVLAADPIDEVLLAQSWPHLHTPSATPERIQRNYVRWAHELGLFAGEVLGLYASDDPIEAEILERALLPALEAHGYVLEVDIRANAQEATPLAVQRFRDEGVTTAILLTDHLAFQQNAEGQGYRPRYPVLDSGYTFVDAVAEITFDIDAMDGNYGMRAKWWDWAQRSPPRANDNPEADYCLDTYQAYTGNTLDSWAHNAEVQYSLSSCSMLTLVRVVLERLGPHPSHEALAGVLESIERLPTAGWLSVTFGPSRFSGADIQGTFQFDKDRWQPSNDYFQVVPPGWQPFWVE